MTQQKLAHIFDLNNLASNIDYKQEASINNDRNYQQQGSIDIRNSDYSSKTLEYNTPDDRLASQFHDVFNFQKGLPLKFLKNTMKLFKSVPTTTDTFYDYDDEELKTWALYNEYTNFNVFSQSLVELKDEIYKCAGYESGDRKRLWRFIRVGKY